MNTSDWALIISCGSLVISITSFVWNVWSKFIFPKPKIRSSISIACLIPSNDPDFVSLSAVNHGPTEITLHSAIALTRKTYLFDKPKFGLLSPLNNFPHEFNTSNGPFSGGLPKKLSVGEQFSVYFPLSKIWIKDGLVRFGFSDTFGRYHWCSKKTCRAFVKKLSNHEDLKGA
ncbi:MAG: hypothetical protein U1E36_07225 [Rickettsiales bacterium]